jgi:hypothetical protein
VAVIGKANAYRILETSRKTVTSKTEKNNIKIYLREVDYEDVKMCRVCISHVRVWQLLVLLNIQGLLQVSWMTVSPDITDCHLAMWRSSIACNKAATVMSMVTLIAV